ncbi:Similar to Protein TOXD; acc. no. P54006 [Pyronema omphalodes CBS 100304]|uniref:Similar to Protein TOXD acc. no. P54006 n=1 Tax=Pyronema omphalodes (strain CBS 100304) TaxID=1076935 RepID=U4L7M7_PYROM|nr:Similar to Protein TOXD; acc. no. P54006 [Pyronema omphalodes CBS 100304]
MKEVIVRANPLRTEIIESPMPTPAADEVVIKVVVTDSNPKDWKYAVLFGTECNAGDDIAGFIEAVGENVYEFKKGDRVAAFHVMGAPYGSYGEYSVAPAHTTWHIPKTTSFEEASTFPLAAMTAALGLYQELGLPAPWKPATKSTPLIVYGGSSGVGAFAIKLAKLSNISPIIAVAGNGIDYVKTLGADKIIDYRKGNVAEQLKEALEGQECFHAYDAISEHNSHLNIIPVLSKPSAIAMVLPGKDDDFPEGIQRKLVMVGTVHAEKFNTPVAALSGAKKNDDHFGFAMYRFFGRALANGILTGHPYTVIEGGLEGIEEGLKRLQDGKASATKYVYRISAD